MLRKQSFRTFNCSNHISIHRRTHLQTTKFRTKYCNIVIMYACHIHRRLMPKTHSALHTYTHNRCGSIDDINFQKFHYFTYLLALFRVHIELHTHSNNKSRRTLDYWKWGLCTEMISTADWYRLQPTQTKQNQSREEGKKYNPNEICEVVLYFCATWTANTSYRNAIPLCSILSTIHIASQNIGCFQSMCVRYVYIYSPIG